MTGLVPGFSVCKIEKAAIYTTIMLVGALAAFGLVSCSKSPTAAPPAAQARALTPTSTPVALPTTPQSVALSPTLRLAETPVWTRTPTPTQTATATPTPKASDTPTLESTPTQGPTSTSASSTSTPRPEPTRTLVPEPTPTASEKITILIEGLERPELVCSILVFYSGNAEVGRVPLKESGGRIEYPRGKASWFQILGSPDGNCPWSKGSFAYVDPKHIPIEGDEVRLQFLRKPAPTARPTEESG